MPKLPHGNRIDDPPPPESPLKFRLALAARKNPVVIAVTILAVIVAVLLASVLTAVSDIRQQQQQLRQQQHQLDSLVVRVQHNRHDVVLAFCRQINANARQSNRQTDVLVNSTKGSIQQARALTPLYLKLGISQKTIDEAIRQARTLNKNLLTQKLPVLHCAKYVQSVGHVKDHS